MALDIVNIKYDRHRDQSFWSKAFVYFRNCHVSLRSAIPGNIVNINLWHVGESITGDPCGSYDET